MSIQYIHPKQFTTTTEPKLDIDENRIQYNFDELLGRKGRTYAFVDYLFEKRPSGLHGAVGTRMRPVHEDEATKREEAYRNYDESPLAYIYDEQDPIQSWSDWIESEFAYDGLEVMYDTSYEFKYGKVVREVAAAEGVMEASEIALVECVGGGRMFTEVDGKYDKVYDEELLRLVKEAEENGVSELY